MNKKNNSQLPIDLRSAISQRRYIYPNLFTLGNLFCGLLAVIYASSGQYKLSVYAVFAGIILDSLDGRVARKFNAESEFGVQFDSLSDLLTFGVAPAFLSYQWYFKANAEQFGVLICFVYLLCLAARLARFNVSKSEPEPDSSCFTGLPSPAAAALVVSTVTLFPDINAPEISIVLATVYISLISFFMVSTIKYENGKKVKLTHPLQVTFLFGLLVATLWYVPHIAFFTVALVYCISGPLLHFSASRNLIYRLLRLRTKASTNREGPGKEA